ncbi:hypothetical protein JCM1393_07240 [Clostridium carnis]
MAASSVLTGNVMSIKYKVGVNDEGKDIFKTQNFKNISADATDDNLIGLSDGIGALLDHTVGTIKKQQTFLITR